MSVDIMELIKYLASLLPPSILGAVLVIIAGLYMHRSKKIPWKIVKTGMNGSTPITADLLKVNCDTFHFPINKSLDTLVINQVKIQEKIGDISETVSFIKGQLSK